MHLGLTMLLKIKSFPPPISHLKKENKGWVFPPISAYQTLGVSHSLEEAELNPQEKNQIIGVA